MDAKSLLAVAALLALAGPATGYSEDRDVVVIPNGWNDAFTGGASLAFCERVSDDATLSGVSPIYCERRGFGAIFSDVGCAADFYPPSSLAIFGNGKPDNAAGCLDDLAGSPATDFGSDTDGKDDFAIGTVTVSSSAQFMGNEVSWLVGNDRDDDGSVTSADSDGSSDTTDENGADAGTACSPGATDDPARDGCFDDEFIFGTDDVMAGFTTPTFCFTHDRDHAGGDWDDIIVFFSANLPPTRMGTDFPFSGSVMVDLTANSNTTPCTRSGHNDSLAVFGGSAINGESCLTPFLGLTPLLGACKLGLPCPEETAGIPGPPSSLAACVPNPADGMDVTNCAAYNAAHGSPFPGQGNGLVIDFEPDGPAGGDLAACAGPCPDDAFGLVANNGGACVCPGGAGTLDIDTLGACGEGPACPGGVSNADPMTVAACGSPPRCPTGLVANPPGPLAVVCGMSVTACSIGAGGPGIGWTVGAQGVCIGLPWIMQGGTPFCTGPVDIRIYWGTTPGFTPGSTSSICPL